MHRLTVALIVYLAFPSTGAAQQGLSPTDNPLAMVAVPQAQLDAALSARQNCQTLIVLINDLGARWHDVGSGEISRRDFEGLHQEALVEWDIRWGACAGARRDLAEGMPRKILDEQVSQLRDLWLTLHGTAKALKADLGAARINQSAESYARALETWSLALPARAKFWGGSVDDPNNELVRSCVWQTERAQQMLSVDLMRAAAADRSLSTDESIDTLRLQLEKTDRLRRECKHESPKEEAELQILARLMRSHRRLFEGFVEGDDGAIRDSMIAAQEAVSRLKRCRNEHTVGATVSPSCLPQ